MGRIRTIKPEFPQSESMGRVSRESRLCFILLWTIADDSGRLRGNSRMLASLLYPYDDDAKDLIDGWLAELVNKGCIVRYEVDGESFIAIAKWLSHQKIDKPSPSKLPEPSAHSRPFANPREDSAADQGKDQGRDQGKDQGRDQGEVAASKAATPRKRVSLSCPEGVERQVWEDFLTLRKAKGAPVTTTALANIQNECSRHGIALQTALEACCTHGWRGFRAEWLESKKTPQKPALSFAEREELAKRKRWEEMTGRKWPTDGEVIEVSAMEVLQ